jgi:c-di-AMP phosphodiesterase-like protein
MRKLIDISFQYFDIFLICILIGLVALILSMVFKKRITLIVVMGVLIIGTVVVLNQMKYTTLFDLYSDQLNEDSDVKSVSITINDFSGNMPKQIRRVTIEDEKTIERILADFSGIKLKEDEDIQHHGRDYHIDIVVTNQIKEDHSSTTTIRLDLDKNYVNDYKIVSKKEYLKTIKSLAEDDRLNWIEYD